MPYITQEKRDFLDPTIEMLREQLAELEMDAMGDPGSNNTEGNLNYIITRLLHLIYGNQDGTRYGNINDAVGLLECVKLEYYRKVAAPYEDQKEFDNGSIAPMLPRVEQELVVDRDLADALDVQREEINEDAGC